MSFQPRLSFPRPFQPSLAGFALRGLPAIAELLVMTLTDRLSVHICVCVFVNFFPVFFLCSCLGLEPVYNKVELS